MGAWCSIVLTDYMDYDHIEKTRTCYKCKDRFKVSYGGLSKRTSCRYHTYENDICKYCNQHKHFGGNCYHGCFK